MEVSCDKLAVVFLPQDIDMEGCKAISNESMLEVEKDLTTEAGYKYYLYTLGLKFHRRQGLTEVFYGETKLLKFNWNQRNFIINPNYRSFLKPIKDALVKCIVDLPKDLGFNANGYFLRLAEMLKEIEECI